ncbi:MAG TPA: hypothetical protein VEQ11_11660 [Chloroflexota bacterium]|nr:hypothetical protein [Chloroflexota bacterium]
MQEAASGRYCRPLDAILKLERGQHASPWSMDTVVVKQILANREQRDIAPLTSVDLIHQGREAERRAYGRPRRTR